MKKQIIIGVFFAVVMILAGAYNSYGEMCGCMDGPGVGMHGEGMLPMRGMKHQDMGMMGAEHPMWRHLMGLGLDEKQRETIQEIKGRVMKDAIRKRADLEIARVELRDTLDKDPVDINVAEAKLKKMESLLTDLRLSYIKAMEEVKAKLTPEQRKKFRETMEMRPMTGSRHRTGGMMHGRMGMSPPCEKTDEMQPPMEQRRH